MLRGAAGAWLGLVVLQTFTTNNGAGAVSGLLGAVDGLVKRALDPSVPAIPDHSRSGNTATVGPDGKPDGGYLDGSGGYVPPGPEDAPNYDPFPGTPAGGHPALYVPGIPRTTNA
jgi:hypothetical protein